MIHFVSLLIIIAIALMLVDCVKSSAHLNKTICLNCIISYVIVLACLLGVSAPEKYYFIDVALIYGLVSLVTNIAFLRYVTRRSE